MRSVEISVIVTVYNKENTVFRALKSVESQTFKNFEVIIIDDGSSDDSPRICRSFCSKNLNWDFFKIKHMGIAKAREYAIKRASGKYISFLDSDDFFERNFLEVSMNNIKDADILICNYKLSYNNFKINNLLFHKSGTFNKLHILKKIISDISIKSFLWNKIFKRSLFDNVFIPNVSCFEDKIICVQLFSKSKKCLIIKDRIYNYRKNPKSITWRTTEKMLNDSIKVSEFISNFFQSQNQYDKIKISQKIFCIQIFFMIIEISFVKNKNVKLFFPFFRNKFNELKRSMNPSKKSYEEIFGD